MICVYLCVPVANKWIHEYGQEFQHRCSLNPQEWRGGAIAGPLWSASLCNCEPQGERRRQQESWCTSKGSENWGACICDWSPKAPGILECTADTAAVDMVEEEEAEEEWGIWQPAPKGEMLFLASSCRWIEAFAFAHCAGFSTLCKAVYLLPALNRDLIQPCSYTGLTQGSAFTNQTLFWNINSKLIINTKSTEIISVSERIRFQEVKIRVTRD